MHKKILISLIAFIILALSFNFCFANDMLNQATDGIKNVVSGTEKTIENAAGDASNMSKNITGNMENSANNMSNSISNTMSNAGETMKNTAGQMGNSVYNATRTSTEATEGTLLGMNSTALTWLIIGLAAIAIVALVWYYSMQITSSNNHRR